MDVFLEVLGVGGVITLGIILIIIAYAGSLLPALPGVPFAALAVILVHFTLHRFAWYVLTLVLILTILISFVDYFVPIWGTKKYGGSPSGVRGSTIGLIAGALISFFTGGLGIIALFAGPFIGAYIGEKFFAKTSNAIALRSAWGSLVGFMAGTLGKIVVVSIIALIFVFGVFSHF